ncbi:MAG: hypothetical protein FWD00_02885, partial [Clostridiales bacterium]|nr:hypothetical protein [Clostridiales bacterium]
MNKRNRQRFGLVLVLVMVMTLFTPHAAVATRTVHDGHHLNIRTEPQQMWFTSVGGRPVETNWYHGHGVTFLCLEYGVSHPAPNLRYVVVDAFVKEHDRSGRPELVLGADGLPMINPNVPALANGRQPTVGEVYAMAYVLHQLNQNRGSREWAYAAQNATRAFWHDRGIFWAGNPVSFNGARFIDSTGNLTAGTVRASSPYSNHILQLAVDLYDDMTRIANSARPDLSGQNQRPSVIPGARTGNQQTFQVNSPGAPWAINRLSLDALLEAGVTPSMTQGPQGTTTLVLSGITEDLTINSFTVNAYAEAMFGNFAFMVPERSGFQIFSAMLPGTAAGIGFEVDIQPNEPEDDAPPFPRLPNARVSANKFDADPGFDGNHTTPRGDARLNARFDVFMDGQFITSFQADERGAGGWSDEFPLWTYSDLTRVTEYHDCSGYLQRVTYTAPARTIRVYEVVPAGMLSEADGQTGNQTGYREFVTQPFHATIYRTIVCISDDYGWCFGHMRNPWPANYTYNFDTLNPSHFTGLSVRNIGPANFYNRVPEGDLIVNKVINRNFDPFGNHLMVQEPMPGARFVIRLTSGGSEGQPYLRAVLVGSGDPDFSPFRNTYRVARGNYGIVMDGSTAASSFVTGPAAGNAQFLVLGIPYGSYQLTEIESNPADFFALSNFGFTIRHDRQVVQNVDLSTVSFTVANTPGEDEIIVRKVCAESGRTIPSAKMGFRIRYMGPLAGTPPHLVNEASIGRLF